MGSSPIKRGLLSTEGLEALVNLRPEESDYALIGHIALNLTALEYQIETLIWYYMESVDKGHIATARLGPVSKTEMLDTFVEWIEPDDGVADAIAWGSKCFGILRESRNSIIHGYNFKADRKAGKLTIERRTKSLVFDSFLMFEINRDILRQVKRDQEALAMYMWRLEEALKRRPAGAIGPNLPPPTEPLELPEKPALPASLSPLPHDPPKSTRRQRQELAAKEAKEAMRGRRGKKPRKEKV